MQTLADFDFNLPTELIATKPLTERRASRLLAVNAASKLIEHQQFIDIIDKLNAGDLLVINNTQVFPARIYGHKSTGGQIECLIERVLIEGIAWVHLKSSRAPKPGTEIQLAAGAKLTVLGRREALFEVRFETPIDFWDWIEQVGQVPLPPYMNRPAAEQDKQRYQTVYASERGAVAAPTAGLHFDKALLDQLRNKGIIIETVTLHVGAGTFKPVKVHDITEHKIHREYCKISQAVCQAILDAKQRGNKVVAVGTTSVRTLEAAAYQRDFSAFDGETELFIYPGFDFKVVDAMITNFHLPKSSLLMLVSAFCGRDLILKAYLQAVEERYRFFSYGDAMWLQR